MPWLLSSLQICLLSKDSKVIRQLLVPQCFQMMIRSVPIDLFNARPFWNPVCSLLSLQSMDIPSEYLGGSNYKCNVISRLRLYF